MAAERTSLSRIIEFREKIDKDKGADFVSFESMMNGNREENNLPDPVDELKSKQDRIRHQTEEMVAKANAEKERIEKEAFEKGFAQGEEAGRISGKKEFDEKIAQALKVIAALEEERASVHKQHEKDLLVLVKTMVERLVGHEVSVNPLAIQNCLHKALEFVVRDSTVQVHLHAEDFQRIKEMSLEDPSLLEGKQRIELLEDPSVSQGGCLLKTDFGEIDATLENCKEKLFDIVDRAFLAALAEDGE